MKQILHWKKRPFVYAITITVGFALLIDIRNNAAVNIYLWSSLILFLVLIFELFSTKFFAEVLLSQYALPPIDDNTNLIHMIHHRLLPALSYWALVLFTFFHHNSSISLLILFLVFICFSLLFTNVRAYYEDKFKLEQNTQSIYDILNFIIIFCFTEGMISAFRYHSLNIYMAFVPITLLFILICVLAILRFNVLHRKIFTLLLAVTLFTILLFVAFVALGFSSLNIAVSFTLMLYLLLGFFHHYFNNELVWDIMLEYIVVFSLLLVLIYGIS